MADQRHGQRRVGDRWYSERDLERLQKMSAEGDVEASRELHRSDVRSGRIKYKSGQTIYVVVRAAAYGWVDTITNSKESALRHAGFISVHQPAVVWRIHPPKQLLLKILGKLHPDAGQIERDSWTVFVDGPGSLVRARSRKDYGGIAIWEELYPYRVKDIEHFGEVR